MFVHIKKPLESILENFFESRLLLIEAFYVVNRPSVRRTAMGCPNLPVLGQMGLMLLKLPLGPCLVVNAYPFNILIAFIIHLIELFASIKIVKLSLPKN